METSFKSHWENIYGSKNEQECSWFQPYPHTSMAFIEAFGLPKNARIIDIGGGDSRLADALLELGYSDITVLDISATAIEKARKRIGDQAERIQWIVSDVLEFSPAAGAYDVWHDRAAFHFLTEEPLVDRYVEIAQNAVCPGGCLILGTFSPKGPKKCSGLDIRQYSRSAMRARFMPFFNQLRCKEDVHITPFQSEQHFLYCSFRKVEELSVER